VWTSSVYSACSNSWLEFFPPRLELIGILSNSFHPLPTANTTGCHKKPFSTLCTESLRQVICGSNLAYLQCGPHPCTPPAAIRDWNSFHHDWNLLEFFPILSTHCMECYNLHGVYNLHGMYSFEQHSIAIDSHENVMEQLSTSLNSVAQPFAALQSFCRALRMSRVHVRKKIILRSPHSNRASHTN